MDNEEQIGPDRGRDFAMALMATLAVAGICLWISNLTDGPEYGGPWDLPFVNYVTWFGFILAAMAAVLVAVGSVLRGATSVRDRFRRSR